MMNRIFHLLMLIMLSLPALGQQPSSQQKNATTAGMQDKGAAGSQAQPPAPPLLSPKICGKGLFLLSLGEQSVGRESFEIHCKADGGYQASGSTNMKFPTGTLNQETTIEVDKAGVPQGFTVKGETFGSPIAQQIVFKGDKAMVTAGGETNELPYTNRAAVLVNGVTYLFQFIAARYDTMRGGEQEIPLFPSLKATMERSGRDKATAPDTAAAAAGPLIFDRYSLSISGTRFIFWTDAEGRLAVITVPAQQFVAAREEYASLVAQLRAAMMAELKDIMPDYSAPAGAPFTAEEVQVQAKGFKLAGTLLLPRMGKQPFPAVVMSTGSGQQERDSNLPGLDKYRPFRQIAEALAARGIAVLRADDRAVGRSGGVDTLNTVTTLDFADDVRAQVAFLRSRPEIDGARIAIIGHSEGGLIAPLVAASDPRLAAIVMMAGTGKRGEDVLRFQLNYETEHNTQLSAEEKAKRRAETDAFIRAIYENSDVSKYPAPLRGLNSPWGRWFLSYDPLTTMRKVRQPVLIMQGALDQQVTAEQARLLEEAARAGGNRDVTVRLFPGLNHLFLPAKSGEEREYLKLETYSLSDEVLSAIADWLQTRLKVGK
jgi:fermentation-respiration switch protein FrsA (DUF1100 family)